MKNIKLTVIALIAALVVGVGGVSLYTVNRNDDKVDNQQSTSQQTTEQTTAKLTSSEDKKTVSYEGQTGKTALEVLKSLADVKTKDSSYGEFVVAINGVEADGTAEFWSFYVNGTLASEGAGTYKSTNGEKIEWRVEKVNQ